MIQVRRLTALGPAIATTSTGVGGPTISFSVPAGLKVAAISARLRTRALSAPIQNGSVLVQAAVIESPRLDLGAPVELGDGIEDYPAMWAGARYVSTARGARFMPGVVVMPEFGGSVSVAVRVWNRDDLDATRRITVDVTVTLCDPEEDVGGVESGHELGDFSPGSGTVREADGANPAAGSEASITQGVGLVWRPLSFLATLVTDGTVTTRVPRLNAGPTATVGAASSQAASLTYVHTWQAGAVNNTTSASAVVAVLPRLLSYGGAVYATVTLNLQAADNYGAPQLQVEEWVVPQVSAS